MDCREPVRLNTAGQSQDSKSTARTPADVDIPPWTSGCLLISGSGVRNPDGARHSDKSSARVSLGRFQCGG